DLADFSDDKDGRLLHRAIARKHSLAPVDQLAAKRARIDPSREMIGETDEQAFLQRFARRWFLAHVESFALGDLEKLLEQRPDLPGRLRVDAQFLATLHVVAVAV